MGEKVRGCIRMVSKILYSSNSDEWETPQDLFDELNETYHFDLDVCATEQNAKCRRFFDKAQDGLKKSWGGRRFGAIRHTPMLRNGCAKRQKNNRTERQRLCWFRHGPTRNGSMRTAMRNHMWMLNSSKDGSNSDTVRIAHRSRP